MANRKSSFQQAYLDMKEMGLEVSFFAGKVKTNHTLNAEIDIVTREVTEHSVKVTETSVSVTCNYCPPEVYKTYSRPKAYRINPDGTVSYADSNWDRD